MKLVRSIAILMALLPFCAHAQDPYPINIDSSGVSLQTIIDQLYNNLSPSDSNEGGLKRKVEFFERFWTARATSNDTGSTMFNRYYNGLNLDMINRATANNNVPNTFQGNWRCIGPFSLPVQCMGYITAIWGDPADSNYILAGTWGGLFKTTDGGANWECITDNAPIVGGITIVNWIAVNPLNKNTIYLGSTASSTLTSNGSANGAALIKTYDGGITWEQEVIPIDASYQDSVRMIQKVYFTADSTRLYAFHKDSLYTRANNNGANWQNITPPGVNPNSIFTDLEFDPSDQNHFFISNGVGTSTPNAAIWESEVAVPSGSDWSKITAGLTATLKGYAPSWLFPLTPKQITDQDFARIEISIPNADELYMIGIDVTDPRYIGLWKYDYSSSSPVWTLVNDSLPFDRNPTQLTFELIVSSASTSNNGYRKNIYYGIDIPYHSYDGGLHFKPIGTYRPFLTKPTHADIRGFSLQSATNSLRGMNDRLFIATDGGVSQSVVGLDDSLSADSTATIDISGYGLAVNHFWSIDISEAGGIAVGGSQHNGIFSYEPSLSEKWVPVNRQPQGSSHYGYGGDNYTVVFDRIDKTKAYVKDQGYTMYFTRPGNGRQVAHFDQPPRPNPSLPYPANFFFPYDNVTLFDPPLDNTYENKLYTGCGRIWKRYPADTVWSPDFNARSANLGGTDSLYKIKDMYFLPDDSIYVGYVLYNAQAGLYYINMHNRATNPFPPATIQLSVPKLGGYPLNAITVDPDSLGNIWIAYGGTNYDITDPTSNRVRYSPDTGRTWIDISKGLPKRVSVNDIIYYQSNKTLYCATDVGMYMCDFSNYDPGATSNDYNASVEWIYFSKGLYAGKDFPNVYVTQLKINHCEGKLFASTYGRSIWATDLFEDDYVVQPNETITSNTTWNTERYLLGSVRVKSGATLTISGSGTTIFMPKNAVIIIEPNAKLIVNDATITNACEECLWGGIRLEGDRTKIQSPLYQGSVELNNATIEHAIVAVGNYDADKSINSSGGIIQAYNTTFLNNEKAIDLTYYHKLSSTFIKDYKATFTLCTFDINDDYKFDNGNGYTGSNPHRFFSHVALYEVDGVIFNGCTFKNSNTGQYEAWGEGIFSTNAGFQVRAYCNSTTPTIPCNPGDLVKNSFSGFKHGIWIEHDNMQNNFAAKVDQATFDYCSIGIRIKNQYLSHLTRNEFTIGNGKEVDIDAFDCHKNIGIFATSTNAPTIEDNSMIGVANANQHQDHENIGIIIEDTRGADIQIYHNTLQDLDKACLALGSNDIASYYINNSTGVQFLCNTFMNNEDDIYVSAQPDASGFHLRGIADHQGGNQSDAGNTFQGTTNTHITNIAAPFVYYYNGVTGSNQPTLLNASSPVSILTSTGQNTCPSNFAPSGGGSGWNTPLSSGTVTGIKANYFVVKSDRDDALSTLNGAIDLANTSGLIDFINNCMVVDTPVLKDTLLNMAPYVSEDALRATANMNILDHSVLMNVLKANPDVLRNEDFLRYLANDIPAPLSGTDIDILQTVSTTRTARTDLESEIVEYNRLMNIQANEVIANYLLDTTDAEKDSVVVWYDNMNNLQAEYAKVAFYTGMGDYTNANSVLTNIPTKFSLTAQQSSDHSVYTDLWSFLKTIHDDNRDVLHMTSGELTDFNDIASTEVGDASMVSYTTGVITTQIGPKYRLACADIQVGEPKPGRSTNISNNKATDNILKVYPNPAKDYVIFEYHTNEQQTARIEVFNIAGQIIYQTSINGASQTKWNTTTIPSGVYTYKLINEGKTINVGKVVITK